MKKRLRKKLGVGEFTEIGFCIAFGFKDSTDTDAQMQKLVAAMREACLFPNHLTGTLFLFVDQTFGLLICSEISHKVSPEQRQTVLDWMNAREDVAQLQVSELADVNDLLVSFPSQDT